MGMLSVVCFSIAIFIPWAYFFLLYLATSWQAEKKYLVHFDLMSDFIGEKLLIFTLSSQKKNTCHVQTQCTKNGSKKTKKGIIFPLLT